MNKLEKILSGIKNKARRDRVSKIASLNIFSGIKTAAADQHGIFQHFQSDVANYSTREKSLEMRGADSAPSRDSLYGVGPEHDESFMPSESSARSLSTRYSPDRVGVQARRVSDGVYQDPYTKKVYDYNDGFKSEDGREFAGGGVSLQSSIMSLGSNDIKVIKKISSALRQKGNYLLAKNFENKFGV
tara:strand:+ start:11753 stop:12313 length:561 start_codon:yes stop_codon:yes gene_type:complete